MLVEAVKMLNSNSPLTLVKQTPSSANTFFCMEVHAVGWNLRYDAHTVCEYQHPLSVFRNSTSRVQTVHYFLCTTKSGHSGHAYKVINFLLPNRSFKRQRCFGVTLCPNHNCIALLRFYWRLFGDIVLVRRLLENDSLIVYSILEKLSAKVN